MSSFTFCTQIQTHAPEPSDVSGCLHRSPRKKGFFFLVTSCSVSLQRVAMATENLLKGLTALLVFRRKGFVWRHLQNPCVCAFVKCVCVCVAWRALTCFGFFSRLRVLLRVRKQRLTAMIERTWVTMHEPPPKKKKKISLDAAVSMVAKVQNILSEPTHHKTAHGCLSHRRRLSLLPITRNVWNAQRHWQLEPWLLSLQPTLAHMYAQRSIIWLCAHEAAHSL